MTPANVAQKILDSGLDPIAVISIARDCHEANRKYCESIGDSSQQLWGDTPPNIQASAVDGVLSVLTGKVKTPEDSHKNWLAFKEADGWTYGDTKDMDSKTHPCMVAYEELPEEQKKKDDIFFATVAASAKLYGVEL